MTTRKQRIERRVELETLTILTYTPHPHMSDSMSALERERRMFAWLDEFKANQRAAAWDRAHGRKADAA